MKRYLTLLFFFLVVLFFVDAKTQTKKASKKAPVCLTVQAENGSIRQKLNTDGTITCIFNPSDLIRVSTVLLNGVDISNQIEKNKLTLPIITENTTLNISFDDTPTFTQPVYNTIAMF